MENKDSWVAFERLLQKIFIRLNFNVEMGRLIVQDSLRIEVDMILNYNDNSTWIESKFYRDDQVSTSNVAMAARQLLSLLQYSRVAGGLLIVSGYLSYIMKKDFEGRFGILVWDRSDLYNIIQYTLEDPVLLDEFKELLLESRQGINTQDVFEMVETFSDHRNYVQDIITSKRKPVPSKITPPQIGQQLCQELHDIPKGKPGWSKYEKKCIEILKYLFKGELGNWDVQNSTDDALSRFDMICRILHQTGFWGDLIQSFRTRYILFEFKNYSEPIGQDQIYTTERYLYLQGLRSVGFIISRDGGKPQAFKASKGALREHGKLIMILTNEDLCKMLKMKDVGDNPSDHLASILDSFLISLSR